MVGDIREPIEIFNEEAISFLKVAVVYTAFQ